MVPHDRPVSNDRSQPDENLAVSLPTQYGADVTNPVPRLLRPRPTGWVLVLTLVGLILTAGCGSSDEFDDGSGATVDDGPRVADPRFDGGFEIVELVVDGVAIAIAERPTVEIETQFGDLTVLPGCNTYFGSFTLDEDGTASFTVTGGSELDCGELADQEDAVLDAMAGVDRWVTTDDGFRFSGPSASLSVVGPTG